MITGRQLAAAVDGTPREGFFVKEEEVPIPNTSRDMVRCLEESSHPRCLEPLEWAEAMDFSDEETKVLAANPDHLRSRVQPFVDPQKFIQSAPPAFDVTPRVSFFVKEEEIPVPNTPRGSGRRLKEPSSLLCVDLLERLETIDLSEEETEEVIAANPDHLRFWVQPFVDPQEPVTPSAAAVESSGNAADSKSILKISTTGTCRPSTSGITSLVPKIRALNDGSDFDSDYDDEFEVGPIETAALFTDRRRDIPEDEELDESVRNVINALERDMDDAADGMIGASSTFLWQEDFDKFRGIPENFSGGTPGPIKDFDSPYDSFIEIWDKDIMERIALETNRYAKQTIDGLKANNALAPTSRLHQWTPTDANEITVLFAVYMYMGIDPRTSQSEYWQANDFLEMPKFKQIMSYSRYVLLNKFLHFVDNTCQNTIDTSLPNFFKEGVSPKLAKLKPVLVHLNTRFASMYNLDRDISIDESLTLFQGRLSWVQAIRTKASRFGIKSYELCESRTGYLYRFQIHTGKDLTRFNVPPGIDVCGKSGEVVLELLKGLEHVGHCVTMDNFYNCPALARYLKSLGFDCLGTLRRNRRHVPSDIAKLSENVARGTMVARHCGDISVIAWKDSKLVTIISTYHNDDTYVASRAGRTLLKPISVRDYNHTMGGVDFKDRKLSMYLLERKRGLKWYMKIFKRLLNVSIHNAFVMYVSSMKRRNKPSMTHREFRYSLAKSLVMKHNGRLPEISEPAGNLMRLRRDIMHVPKYMPGAAGRKRCRVCYQQKVSRHVHSHCVTCGVALCFEPCWTEWHSSEDIKPGGSRVKKGTLRNATNLLALNGV